MTTLSFRVEGVAFWAPTLPGWPIARAAFHGERGLVDPPARRPAPEILAPAERRRAPDSVALALEVAAAATMASGREPGSLASIFSSAHGDLAVNDYMCSTLASTPTLISPTRFHNSVHNAASGYWTIGAGCTAASSALSAYDRSFAAGLLEAVTQCAADRQAVLLVACDVQAVGALATVTASTGLLAVAVVVAPCGGGMDGDRGGNRSSESGREPDGDPAGRGVFTASLVTGSTAAPALRSEAARSLAGNAMADALPFMEAIALGSNRTLSLPLSSRLALRLTPAIETSRPAPAPPR